MFVGWLLIDVEHWLLSLLAVRLSKYRLGVTRGVGTVSSGRLAGWTRCWVLRKRALPGDLGLRDRWPRFSVMEGAASVGPVVF
jgi:hypothetical protein